MSTKNTADTNLIQWVKTNPLLTFLLTILCILLIVLFAAFVAVMVSETAEKFIGQLLGSTKKNDTLTFLGIGMGGILLALQAVIANRRAKAMENAAREQAKANQNTEKGQRQERLKNAIEHLGHESDSVRLGGAYELFHLAQDTEDLRQTVMDILCAHIRRTTGEAEYQEGKYKWKPSEEIQSLLTLLFVQELKVFKGLQINLQGSYLNGANLRKARLAKAVLSGAHLQKADLSFAYLQRAFIDKAYLQKADLSFAYLQRAFIFKTQLQEANLSEARLQEANFSWAELQGANLDEAYLQGAHLERTQLQGANLFKAQLHETYIKEADLRGSRSRDRRRHLWTSFEDRIRESIGKEVDLSGIIFSGGLHRKGIDFLFGDTQSHLRENLKWHVGKSASSEPPENSGAITKPPYTKEEAEQWIAEYEEAMSEVPKPDNGQ